MGRWVCYGSLGVFDWRGSRWIRGAGSSCRESRVSARDACDLYEIRGHVLPFAQDAK
jgi:hypothetical protein